MIDSKQYARDIKKRAAFYDVNLVSFTAIVLVALPMGGLLILTGDKIAALVTFVLSAVASLGAAWCGRKATSSMITLAEYIRLSPKGTEHGTTHQ